MAYIWANLFLQNGLQPLVKLHRMMILLINLLGWKTMQEMLKQDYYTTVGTKVKSNNGLIKPQVLHPIFGLGQWVGTVTLW